MRSPRTAATWAPTARSPSSSSTAGSSCSRPTNEDGSVELICPPAEFTAVKAALEAAGLKAEFAEVTMKPLSETVLAGDEGARMQRLLDALEALDDVQEVYTTALVED
jgi:transcriptional/translational regulatory protein YebC/TACO1